jgi:hypothetical protein
VKKVLANPEPSTHDPGCVKIPPDDMILQRFGWRIR